MDNLFVFLNKSETPACDNSSAIDTDTETETDIIDDIINEPIIEIKTKEKKKYDQSKYNKNFMEKNKDKINQKIICDTCCGSYSYYNKSKHMKSLKHLNLLNKQNQK
jgi:hypothetical protein